MTKKKSEKREKQEQEQKQDKDQEIRELTQTLQRVQAEFENYKKRVEKENAAYKDYAETELVKRLLPVLDSCELAIQSNTKDAEKLKKGIEMLYAQLYSMLKQAGLKPIKCLGQGFDAYKHEVVMKQESEKEGIILEEFQKGYTFKDKVIRHSKVKVGKREKKEKKDADIKTNTQKSC